MFVERLSQMYSSVKKCCFTTLGDLIDEKKAMMIFHSFLNGIKKKKGKVYVIGNGGSAGIASHFSNDLLKTLKIPSSTLVDSNMLTCFSNDYGYEYVFSKPLEILLDDKDLLVAISSSGNSKNIINAVNRAKDLEVKVVTLSGFSPDNVLRSLGDLNFWIDAKDYGLVEISHFFILHTIVDLYGKINLFNEKEILQKLCLTN